MVAGRVAIAVMAARAAALVRGVVAVEVVRAGVATAAAVAAAWDCWAKDQAARLGRGSAVAGPVVGGRRALAVIISLAAAAAQPS